MESADAEEAELAAMEAPPTFAPALRRRLTKEELIQLRENMPVQREPLWQPKPFTYPEKVFYPVLKALGMYSKWAQYGANADAVWRSIEEQATHDCWFEALNLRRTFMTEHALLTMHVWILHKRHMLDFFGEGLFNGRLADKELFTRFWDDTQLRIRNAGIEEMSVNKQLEMLQKASFMDMFEYDAALRMDDDNMELSAAVFKGVFQSDENANIEDVIRLADWLRREVANILTQPKEDVYRGWITWSPAVGETREQRLDRQRALFAGEWREKLWVDGSLYFFNTITEEVSRKCPPEGLYGRRRFALANHLKHLADRGEVDPKLVNPGNLRSFAVIDNPPDDLDPTRVVLEPAGATAAATLPGTESTATTEATDERTTSSSSSSSTSERA